MRKTISILLFFSLMLQVCGYHLIFKIRRSEIREEMSRIIEFRKQADETETLVFELNQSGNGETPEWENNHEFRYKGHLYDLVSEEIQNGKRVLHVMCDQDETELVNQFENQAKNDFGKNPDKKSAELVKLISSLFTPVHIHSLSQPVTTTQTKWPHLAVALQSGLYKDIPKPPPQLV